MRHRVGDTIDRARLRELARTMTANRAAQFLGVNCRTIYRIADREGIAFVRVWGYGWRGIR